MTLNQFWLKQSKLIVWDKTPTIAFKKKSQNRVNWFPDGKLNIFKNCITNNLDLGLKKKIAIYNVDKYKKIKSYTYENLNESINNFSFFLVRILKHKLNNTKIIIHGSASIETTVTMMACAKLGLHFSVIFEDLAPEAISKRIKLIKPTLFITRIEKKEFEKKFFRRLNYKNNLKFIFLKNLKFSKPKSNYSKLINHSFKSDKDFFTLFTSGTTGNPKGIVHSSGGYLVATKLTCQRQFGMNKDSVVVTASNAGWLNGHTYALFGPLSFGATTILLEDPMSLLDEDLLKKILGLKVSILYLPVTIIRLMKSLFNGKSFKTNYLKTLGSMGEHLAPSVAEWFAKTFTNKNNAIVNAYYQTENGAIISSPTFKDKISKMPHGSVGRTVTKYLKVNSVKKNIKTELKLTTPWPGNMKRILNGKKEWDKYWDNKGNFRMFDLATKKNNNLFVHGRNDDVINIRGHRIGCEEIESIILTIKKIFECCVISLPDKFEGEIIYLFLSTKEKNLDSQIRKKIVDNFGSFAIPSKIFYVNELPKTRSGKILRKLLRDMLTKPNAIKKSDLNVMVNKKIFYQIIKQIKK